MRRRPDDPDAYVPVRPTPIADLPRREIIWRSHSCRYALCEWCEHHGYHAVGSPDFPMPPKPGEATVQQVMRPDRCVRVRVAPITIRAVVLHGGYPSYPGSYVIETLGPVEPRS